MVVVLISLFLMVLAHGVVTSCLMVGSCCPRSLEAV